MASLRHLFWVSEGFGMCRTEWQLCPASSQERIWIRPEAKQMQEPNNLSFLSFAAIRSHFCGLCSFPSVVSWYAWSSRSLKCFFMLFYWSISCSDLMPGHSGYLPVYQSDWCSKHWHVWDICIYLSCLDESHVWILTQLSACGTCMGVERRCT